MSRIVRNAGFEQVKEAVQSDVILAASDYELIKRVLWPLMNQRRLLEHYPWLVPELYKAVTGNIVMALCRLFDSRRDARNATLATFLCHVQERPSLGVKPYLKEKQEKYIVGIPELVKKIKRIEKRLTLFRSAYLAHSDLTKRGRADAELQWQEIESFIGEARGIVRGYCSAFEGADQRFEIVNVEWETRNFLQWCRLDDYSKHHGDSVKAKMQKKMEELRKH